MGAVKKHCSFAIDDLSFNNSAEHDFNGASNELTNQNQINFKRTKSFQNKFELDKESIEFNQQSTLSQCSSIASTSSFSSTASSNNTADSKNTTTITCKLTN